ncbi:hypothetical protein MED01_002453 [Micromonospora sp. MED01]|uniref:hypothetical protein n=1 Tax=Micromonospora alfalfae TaxID=2911212 RepID=UPI001EE8F29D|nr:hypothetical protein [Micromonospora alfalfae]MCG5464287.1 hypothetical protein [Micromonospora alfalfae]
MTRLRRILGLHGAHRPGVVRPLSDVRQASDPWAKGEADDPMTDTMVMAVIL